MLTIVGLGPGNIGNLTLETWDIIKSAAKIYLRTSRHPCVDVLREKGIIFEDFDKYYEKSDSFEEVYRSIAAVVLKEADGQEAVFAVPGSPFVAEKTVELLLSGAREKGLPVKIISGMSFLEALYTSLKIDPTHGLTVVDCSDIANLPQNINTALVLTQIFDQKTASDTKLALMEHFSFDDNQPVIVASNLGLSEETLTETVLYKIDRLKQINHLTCIYIPPGRAPKKSYSFNDLVNIMAKLRSPDGCAWDLEQNPKSICGYLVEEVYEVLEAIDLNDSDLLAEELGDLLLHILFQSRMAEESGLFSINDVIDGISAKMIRRHPHVFGNTKVRNAAEVITNWDKIKKEEKSAQRLSVLDGIPKGAPSLLRAFKLQDKAAKVGFDWDNIKPVWEKVCEELEELKEAVDESRIIINKCDKTKTKGELLNRVQDELGDVFFALVNLSRFLDTDPETALNAANNKFMRRIQYMEKTAADRGLNLLDCTLSDMDKLWEEAKKILPKYS